MFERYPDVVTVNQLCNMLGIGKNKAYELIQANKIRSIRVGRKYIIPKKYVIKYLNK